MIDAGNGIGTRLGRFAFSELIAWQKMLLPHLSVTDGFVGTDADESINQVRVKVRDEAARTTLMTRAKELGIPLEAIAVELGEPLTMAHNLSAKVRPVSGSYQIQHYEASNVYNCTIGWNVNVTGTGAPGKGFLTAGHCDSSLPGDGVTRALQYQATAAVGNDIGWVYGNPVWNRTDPECMGVVRCSIADVMYVKYHVASNAMARIAKTDFVGINNQLGSLEANWYIEPVYAVMIPYIGLQIDKVGRTTGWTRGTVSATCSNQAGSGYWNGVVSYTTVILCHDQFSTASGGGGDSGAPVFRYAAPGAFMVGVMFAKSPALPNICTSNCVIAFTRWDRIKQHLNMPTMSPVF